MYQIHNNVCKKLFRRVVFKILKEDLEQKMKLSLKDKFKYFDALVIFDPIHNNVCKKLVQAVIFKILQKNL